MRYYTKFIVSEQQLVSVDVYSNVRWIDKEVCSKVIPGYWGWCSLIGRYATLSMTGL